MGQESSEKGSRRASRRRGLLPRARDIDARTQSGSWPLATVRASSMRGGKKACTAAGQPGVGVGTKAWACMASGQLGVVVTPRRGCRRTRTAGSRGTHRRRPRARVARTRSRLLYGTTPRGAAERPTPRAGSR
eukprot:scaffold1567_cov106-Isochrysis_galbana.AAC.5